MSVPLYGVTNPMAFEASPFAWGDTALANEAGTSAFAMGHDPAQATKDAMQTAPETTKSPLSLWSVKDYLDSIASGDFPIFGPLTPFVPHPKITSEQAGKAALGNRPKVNILGTVVLIVLGLILFAKGLSAFTEGKAGPILAQFVKKGEAA